MTPYLILLYLVLCFVNAFIGRNRAIGFWGVFVLALLLTPPIMGFLLLISAPKTPLPDRH